MVENIEVGTYLETGQYVFRDTKSKEWMLDIEPIKVMAKKGNHYGCLNNSGDIVVINDPKKDYKRKLIGVIEDNSILKQRLEFFESKVVGEEGGSKILVVAYDKDGKKKFTITLSNKRFWSIKEIIEDHYVGPQEDYDDSINFGNEVKVFMAIFKSQKGIISTKSLVDMGMKRNTAWSTLQEMVKRGTLKESSKSVGNKKKYTCVISKDKLAKRFGFPIPPAPPEIEDDPDSEDESEDVDTTDEQEWFGGDER